MKLGIGALVRGYKDIKNYDLLISRNKAIKKVLIKKLKIPSEIILFHEGNIGSDHQKHIIDKSMIDIKFVDVSKEFLYNKDLQTASIDFDRFKSGYRLMCKFNACGIWKYLDEYNYFMRIDEDVIIKKVDLKLLNNPTNLDNSFYTASLSDESHEPTNDTLPLFLKSLFKLDNTNFYNHKFPYTNLYITDVSIFRRNEIISPLKAISDNSDQFIYRWGDLPILGSILNIFEIEIKKLKKTEYFHISHNVTVGKKKLFKLNL